MIHDTAAITALTPEQLWIHYGEAFIAGAFKVVSALAILVAGLWITGAVAKGVRKLAQRHPRIDNTLGAFFASIVHYVLMAFVLIAVLDQFGVQTTQIVAVLGAATLAIGLALQGTLSNVAAGVMLILFRPYRLGDFVELAGRKGIVRDVNIFITELSTPDNVKITLPNGQCWGAPILNFTANGTRMVETIFQVPHDADVDAAIALVTETIKADARTLKAPAPLVNVATLSDYAVGLQAQYWCATGDYPNLRMDMMRAVRAAFAKAGIGAPMPATVTYQHEPRAS
ncbi:MAG: mechanosensitive ion channel [Hyphomonadaceae bacterium]|nr:mechanosensitive ion channel [Hyphomonadaceae bacterium]